MGSNRHRQRARKAAAPEPSKLSRVVFWSAILAGLLFLVIGIYTTGHVKNASEAKRAAASQSSVRTLKDLLALKPGELDRVDIALMNLLCAQDLPGAEELNVDECLATLDQWARHVKSETERNFHQFQENPANFESSEGYFRMLMMAVVVYEDFGVRYNPQLISTPGENGGDTRFFADSRDILIHGLLGPQHRGTCSSMPVLYLALGRRLGYPLKLVTTREHLFLRWEDAADRFDLEATGKGMNRYNDEHFRQWPFPITDAEINENGYLKSLTPAQELSVFLSIRGACLMENRRLPEAVASFDASFRLAPEWKDNQVLLAVARQRLSGGMQPSANASQQRANVLNPQQPAANNVGQSGPPDPNPLKQMQNQNPVTPP